MTRTAFLLGPALLLAAPLAAPAASAAGLYNRFNAPTHMQLQLHPHFASPPRNGFTAAPKHETLGAAPHPRAGAGAGLGAGAAQARRHAANPVENPAR